jgi:hypothetical protein
MMFSIATQRIQRRLGFRKDLNAAIQDEIMAAQEKYERGVPVPIAASAYMGRFLVGGGSFMPWFLRTEVSTITTTIGEERVPLPTDFIREYEEDALYWFNPNADPTIYQNYWLPLWKDDIQFNRQKYGALWYNIPPASPSDTQTSNSWFECGPRAYSLDGNYFRIFPTPQQVYTLKMIYYAQDAVLNPAIDSENKWLEHASDILIGEAGYQVAATARDDNRIQYFQTIRDEGVARLFVYTEAQQHENRTYKMGRED